MKKIYGNSEMLSTFRSMVSSGRTAHTLLIYGEKGSGRKLAASYYTQLLLCEAPTPEGPCGRCPACRNTEHGAHPDVVYAERSGKLGGYSVDTARDIISDAFIKPNNNTGRKIYLFTDCHNVDIRTQNTLLKLIEEPPDYAYFIFTAESKAEFLPTVISRSVCLSTSLCTAEDTRAALADEGFSENDIQKAMECFHGNIGRCISYITDENVRKQVDLTKSLADSIIRKDEYALNVAFNAAGKERSDAREVLSLLDQLVRDAAVLGENKDAELIGCCRSCAEGLSALLTAGQAMRIHWRIERAWEAVEANVSIPLVLTALCAEIADIAGQ
ncbi:MAG: DNA polymerase III subunit delta' [Ruminococcus sp.]|nr:DNA polymerase III subunit delta' [Ruminococcus sp.]